MDATDRATGFLRSCGMFHADIDAARCLREFADEMEAGLSGRASSLRMIPTFIEAEGDIPAREPVIAMDAGGTNLRIALVEFDAEGDPRITGFERHRMPGLDGEIPCDQFFDVLAGHLQKLAPRARRVGLSFSYPAEILPSKDGKILSLSKELRVSGIVGEHVGARINAALRSKGARSDLRFVVVNDTVGALLAGRAAHGSHRYSRYVGFVLGTGLNAAYVESNERVKKRGDLPAGGRQIINMESGAYGHVPRGKVDLALDAQSAEPGNYQLEKAVSGAYLGALGLRTLQAAAEEGLFTKGAAERLRAWPKLETPELEPFLGGVAGGAGLHADLSRAGSADDLALAHALVEHLLERAAKLVAVNMSAALLGSVATGPAEAPAAITVDGSTFYFLRSYRERITAWVDRLMGGKPWEVLTVENAALIGAAVGGITN